LEKGTEMSIDATDTDIELEYSLRAARKRTYIIAFVVAVLGAIPATILKDRAPWFILVPITIGGLLVIGLDIREAWCKSRMLRLVRDITVSESKMSQSLGRLWNLVREGPGAIAEAERANATVGAQAREEQLRVLVDA
jgi:hypothetical protein